MLEQELILNRYRIIGKAGSGGYATVQHAFDTHLKRDVAIKCIRITRADVDAAKRTAALIRQLNAQENLSIPIGSSRVIPAGGSVAARIRRDAERGLMGRAQQSPGAFGVVDMGSVNPLPADPSFLGKREERLRQGREGRRPRRASELRDAAQAQAPAPVQPGAQLGARGAAAPPRFDDRLVQTRDISALATMLPGAIPGAGQTEIGGIDDAVNVNIEAPERGSDEIPVNTLMFDGVSGYANGDAWVSRKKPSFLADMDAEEQARWRGGERAAVAAGDHGGGHDGGHGARGGARGAQGIRYAASPQDGSPRTGSLSTALPGATAAAAAAAAYAEPSPSAPVTAEEVSQLETVPGLEEARTAAHLNDANIVTVYDCVVEGDMAYVIMEYVEGKTLARLIRDLGDEITLDMISAVFAGVAHALEVAHKSNVLHLDIKPENVIVNKEGVVKVTDFGLSTLMDGSGRGKTGGGTIGYMPLEQMRRRPLDVRTDEWALASLTYEMLSGANPFRAKSLAEAEVAIEDAEIVLPSRCWDGMSETVDDIMFTALSPDAEGRFDTVTAFAKALSPKLGSAKAGVKQLAGVVGEGAGTAGAGGAGAGGTGALSEALSAPAKGGLFRGLFHTLGAPGGRGVDADELRDADAADEPDVAAVRAPSVPLIDRLGEQGARWVMRACSGISGAMIAVVALLNFRVLFDASRVSASVPDTTFGMFSISPVVAWIVLAALVAVAFFKPKVGYVVVYLAFSVSLMLSQAWLAALLLLLGMGAWWWFEGRHSDEECTLVMMQPLLGAFGFAAVVPVVAGAVLGVKQAASVTLAAVVSAIVFAALGSNSLANWDVFANFIVAVNPIIAGAAITNGLMLTLSSTITWLTALAWLGAAAVYALCCLRGTKAFDVLGSVACAALLVGGMLVVPWLVGLTSVVAPLAVTGVVVPAVLAVVLALGNVTDRVRLAEGEW